jgi:chromosome segregation ATPase
MEERSGIRARGEEALGDLAQALLENPLVGQAVSRTVGAGERAAQAQRAALGALHLASGEDLERLERRLRSLSDRLEDLEDQVDDLTSELASLRRRESSSTTASSAQEPLTPGSSAG